MDLIDRDELEKELQNSCNDYSDAIHIVWDMPTVNAVPLSVIDEIKAEVENMINRTPISDSFYDRRTYLEKILKIIDRKVKEYTDG